MSKNKFQSIRGMKDIVPEESIYFEVLIDQVKRLLNSYGYQPFHPPILETTALYTRSIGETTDVVEKEMFTFDDFEDSVTMRPEATAGMVRAVIQNGYVHGQHKLWTVGPMFRRERPQKGRYRQFHQIDVECFGIAEPELDAEQIILLARLWKMLGIEQHVTLEINTIATLTERQRYRQTLVEFYQAHYDKLDEDSQNRLLKNPLRILDSKNPEVKALNRQAPKLSDYLGEASQQHFARVLELLDIADVAYHVNPMLVRGLDYYNHTVFEWTTDKLGSQGTICGGGRYDGLTEHLGGASVPGIGFAIGVERLLLLLEEVNQLPSAGDSPLVYLILLSEKAKNKGLQLAEALRDKFKDEIIITHLSQSSMKAQLKKADQSEAKYAIIMGEPEIEQENFLVKDLQSGQQRHVNYEEVFEILEG